MKRILMAGASLGAASGVALAHPGDHAFSVANSLFHLLTEPDHLAMIAAAVAIAAFAFYKFKRRSV